MEWLMIKLGLFAADNALLLAACVVVYRILRKTEVAKTEVKNDDMFADLVEAIKHFGDSADEAAKRASKTLARHRDVKDLNELVRLAYESED